jgi:hypothetical protein
VTEKKLKAMLLFGGKFNELNTIDGESPVST